MGEARFHEAAVAAGCAPADRGALHQHDVAGRVALLGEDGGPQARVAAADDAQIAGLGPHERLVGLGLVGVIEPVRVGLGVGEGAEVQIGGHGRVGQRYAPGVLTRLRPIPSA